MSQFVGDVGDGKLARLRVEEIKVPSGQSEDARSYWESWVRFYVDIMAVSVFILQ